MSTAAPTACCAALAAALLAAQTAAPARAGESALEVSRPYRLSPHVAPGETFMGIRLLGSIELALVSVDGQALGGLSALAWDEDEKLLYALSDRGSLFHLQPHFENGYLVGAGLLAGFALRDQQQRPLRGRHADAEAMVLRGAANGIAGDSLLAVAFERYPRIVIYTPQGRYVDRLGLPAALSDASRYADPNKALEALTWLPWPGFLTAPERPLVGSEDGTISLMALDGSYWRYPLRVTANASLVDMLALPDGSLLTLERGHGLMFLPLVISLRHTHISPASAGQRLAVATLAVLDSSQGWSIDNFEGVTHHQGMKFFMVSDDNFNELQKTLLVYFETTDIDDPALQGNMREYELHQQTPD